MATEQSLVNLLVSISGSPVVTFGEKPEKINTNVIVWNQISNVPVRYLKTGTTREKSRYQIDCYSQSLSAVKTLADLVKAKLDCNVTDFIGSFMIGSRPFKDIDSGLYRIMIEFIVE